jgi:hypothetical protein
MQRPAFGANVVSREHPIRLFPESVVRKTKLALKAAIGLRPSLAPPPRALAIARRNLSEFRFHVEI